MPKGCYSRDGVDTSATWTDEQDEWLRLQCLTAASYGIIAAAFNVAFPNDRKSRSAIMGRASRRGFADTKPTHRQQYNGGKRRTPTARKIRTKKVKPEPKVIEAPVVFKDATETVLREEGLIASTYRYGRKSKEQVEEAKKGSLPSIIENAPLTSVPWSECPDDGCKWPTCDDPFMVCGSKATIGSYCSRHGNVAFREMPTARRNKRYAQRGSMDLKRRMVTDPFYESPGIAPDDAGALIDNE